MSKALKGILNIGLVLFFVVFFSAQARADNTLPAPTLVAPNQKTVTADLQPNITGLTKSNTLVKIYIDDVFNGATGILKNDSGTANFAYRPAVDLSRGFHKITAIAEDVSGQSSQPSAEMNFKIELPLPAPTMFKPVVNQSTSLSRPFIVGLAKNDSKIKIYIDKKYNGEFTVKNHPSGTANFAYKPIVALARGSHSVYTIAVDKRGKESIRSNQINFSTKTAAISESAQEARQDVVSNIKEPKAPDITKPGSIIISSSSGAVVEKPESIPPQPVKQTAPADKNLLEKQTAIMQALAEKEKEAQARVKSLIGEGNESPESDRGMVNEDKQNQSRLRLSVILFILFLIGVVAWLLWVNRELVKERRAQNEADDKMKENKDITTNVEQKDKLL